MVWDKSTTLRPQRVVGCVFNLHRLNWSPARCHQRFENSNVPEVISLYLFGLFVSSSSSFRRTNRRYPATAARPIKPEISVAGSGVVLVPGLTGGTTMIGGGLTGGTTTGGDGGGENGGGETGGTTITGGGDTGGTTTTFGGGGVTGGKNALAVGQAKVKGIAVSVMVGRTFFHFFLRRAGMTFPPRSSIQFDWQGFWKGVARIHFDQWANQPSTSRNLMGVP